VEVVDVGAEAVVPGTGDVVVVGATVVVEDDVRRAVGVGPVAGTGTEPVEVGPAPGDDTVPQAVRRRVRPRVSETARLIRFLSDAGLNVTMRRSRAPAWVTPPCEERTGFSAGDQEQGVDGDADQTADHGAVDPDELEVPAQLQLEPV
jgi:hypothetical protein